jgi:tetratricopeptide (TPR) repeat protein
VTYYEQAADRYGEAGLFNNAIALCNKALRYVPDKVELFRTLGKFCASQGFVTDARRWYLEYAERKFHLRDLDSAFDALEEIAGILEDVEIREMLGRRLHGHQRHEEALAEFRRAYGMRWRAGELDEADALKQEVRELYPDAPEGMWDEEREAAYVGAVQRDAHAADLPALAERDAVTGTDEAEEIGEAVPYAQQADESDEASVGDESSDEVEGVQVTARFEEPAAPPEGRLEGFETTRLVDEEPAAVSDEDEATESFEETSEEFAAPDTLEPPLDDAIESVAPLAGLESTAFTPDEEDEVPEPLPGFDDFDDAAFDGEDEDIEGEESAASMALPLLVGVGEETHDAADTASAAPEFDSSAGLPSLGGVLGPGSPMPPSAAASGSAKSSDYVDLLDLIGTPEPVQMTRFFVEEQEPTGDEDRDFAELLAQFKAKLAEHVGEEDAGSHYDLGLAFKEMGLIDEAISEFQVALRHGDSRLKIFEELGQCFSMKGQHSVAVKILTRAMQVEHGDDLELIGVFYHLGRASGCGMISRKAST